MGQGADVWELLAVALRGAVVELMILKMHLCSSLGGPRERERESERARERESEREGGREGGREGESMCVCVCVCVCLWGGLFVCALCERVYLCVALD